MLDGYLASRCCQMKKSVVDCGLVCKEWDKLIIEEIWKTKSGGKHLSEKLVHRWKTADPIMSVQLSETRENAENLLQ